MKLLRFDRPADLAVDLAGGLLDRIRHTPELVLGLATGQTPLLLYRELRERSAREPVDWSGVRTFNLDEFVGGDEAGARYHAFMRDELFDHVNLRPDHIHLLNGQAPDLPEECARYERAIDAAGGIDLQILGVGVNGHIGFNEPAETLFSRTHVARLEAPTRERNAWLFGGDVTRVPREALSMGMGTIFHAREIVMLATGPEKADAVRQMVEGPITTGLPASLLQLHPSVRVLVDRGAAAALSRR